MSFDEKGTWLYLVVNVVTSVAYLSIIAGRADGVPVTEVTYVPTLLWTIGIAIALSILGHIAIAIAKPSEADTRDVRDKEINRLGDYVGGIVLGVGMLLPFGLAMAEFDYFWIANARYLVFVLSALTGSVVKLVAYRRGF